MNIICPKCSATAELSDDFGMISCQSCSLSLTYSRYLDILVQRLMGEEESRVGI